MADEPEDDTAPTGSVVRPKRASSAVLDMVRSLGVLAVVVALTLIFVPGLLHPSKSQRFAAISYSDDVDGFHEVTSLRALVPVGLPAGWYANSAALEHSGSHAHLHIGWVTPNNNYLAVEESNQPAAAFVRAVLGARGVKVVRYEKVSGETWTSCVSSRGEQSLTRTTADGITVVITGSGSAAQQDELAGSLRQLI